MLKMKYTSILLMSILIGITACKNTTEESMKQQETVVEEIQPTHYDWSKNAVIYEVNTRQYSKDGNLDAVTSDLPRLQKMGIDIIWLMPIFPISEKNRKEGLGSPYAVRDYRAINPEFGTMADFDELLVKAHELGMKVILDWVPNHTGWDHAWITEHPEFYTQDKKGNIIIPQNPNEDEEPWDWTDVADLNYDNQDMRDSMINMFKFWVEKGVDGFRCDVAHQVPTDFWATCIQELYKVNPNTYMLSEGEVPSQRNEGGFVSDYAWSFKNYMNAIGEAAQEKKEVVTKERSQTAQVGEKVAVAKASDFNEYLKKDRERFKKGYHMYFTTNHDENTWEGTVFERLGDGHLTFAVMVFTFDGMPLIYNGQEAGLDKRLKFFTKDEINWGTYKFQDFYTKLIQFKKDNPALWNGTYGAEPVYVPTADANDEVYAYIREKDGNKVFVVLNLSNKAIKTTLPGNAYAGTYTELFSGKATTFEADELLQMKPWEYRAYSMK
jgi:glycosidase